MNSIPIHNAVGRVLAHDVTRIVPGQTKGPAFRKGHIIQEQDIEALLDMGKANICVLEMSSDQVHEDAAAQRIAAAAAGQGLAFSAPSGTPNVYYEIPIKKGEETAPLMAKAAHVVEGQYYLQRQPHLTMERTWVVLTWTMRGA